jgi:hypothetical protein
MFLDTFAILDNVSSTEGVSFSQVITWQLVIFGMFISVILGLFNYMNNRFTEASTDRKRIEDKLTGKFDGLSKDQSDKFDKVNESLFLIKAQLGIIKVEEKPQINPPDESK